MKYKQFINGLRIAFGLKPYDNQLMVAGPSLYWTNGDSQNFIKEAFLKNAGVYSVVMYISELAAIAPFKVYKIRNEKKHRQFKGWTGKGATIDSIQRAMMIKDLAYEEANEHPFNKLLERPNTFQKGQSFISNSIGYRLITGERFLLINKLDMGANAGLPFELLNLPPQWMQVRGDGTLYGIDSYVLTVGKIQIIPKESVIFNRKWNPDFGTAGEQLRGLSPLKAGMRSVDRSNSAVDRSTSYLQNAGANGMAFEKSGLDISSEQLAQFKYKFNNEVLGTDNAGKIAIAQGDWGFTNFGYDTKDLAVEELERLSFQDICRLYRFPGGLLDPDKMSYNNAREFKREAITMAVVPELQALRDDFNDIIQLYGEGYYVDYDLSVYPELQANIKETSEIMAASWWITPNEKRLAMNLDEDTEQELLDDYLVPSGLVPISQISIADDISNFNNSVSLPTGNV